MKQFKLNVGHANHMLVTIMVGLDGIVSKDIEANEEFHAVWNPKDKATSVDRSKIFAKKASLVWLVDCLDAYLRMTNQAPSMVNDELKQKIDSEENSKSVYKRISLICSTYNLRGAEYALIDLLICWRNKLTHYNASNDIEDSSRAILIENYEEIKMNYRGLDIKKTLDSFDNRRDPTFKEVASFVSSSINLIRSIDAILISDLDLRDYADRVIIHYLRENKISRLNNLFSKNQDMTVKSLRQILFHSGFTAGDKNEIDEFCASISHLDFAKAKVRCENGTFIE